MTPRAKPAPKRTCPECELTGAWHYNADATESWRCANYLAADLLLTAHTLTKAANEAATEAARRIVEDAARTRAEFSANDIRGECEAAGIPGPVMGGAFTWAAGKAGLIEGTGRRVMSTDPATRHKIEVWRSLVWRGLPVGRTA